MVSIISGNYSRVWVTVLTAFYLVFAVADDAVVSQESHWSNYFLAESLSDEIPDDAVPLLSSVVKNPSSRVNTHSPGLTPVICRWQTGPIRVPLKQSPQLPPGSAAQDLPVLICVFRI